jgi:acyl-CoA thioester hydrolase
MGIVHHSNYPVWFEAGRGDFLKKCGFSYGAIEDRGIMLPLYELNCRFLSPARYEDKILVVTKLKKLTGVRIVFAYKVYNRADNRLLADGETSHAWVNTDMRPVNAGKIIPEVYAKLREIAGDG